MEKLKIFLIFFLLLLVAPIRFSLANNIVAEVAGEPITWLQMQDRYELLWKDYQKDRNKYPSISQETFQDDLKKIALDQLIKEKLYQIYAEEHNITVSNQELEATFRGIYSDNEMFLSDGRFDEQKFLNFKNQHPQTYQEILNKIQNDVLNEKIEQVIKQQFQVSDQQLFDIYFNDNSKVILKYIVIPDSLMPDMFPSTPPYLQEFYQKNRKNYPSAKEVKIKFFIVEDRNFASQKNSKKGAHSLSKTAAEKLIRELKWGFEDEQSLSKKFYIFETDYLHTGDKIGLLKNSKNIVKSALRQEKGEYFSHPIEQDEGWIVFQTADIKKSGLAGIPDDQLQVWKDYIKSGAEVYFNNKSDNYFKKNIDNQKIRKVNISYILFNTENLHFDINIPYYFIERYYQDHIEDFATEGEALPFEKVKEEILEILAKQKKNFLTDSLISAVCEKVENCNFDTSIPQAKVVKNVDFIQNLPYYKYPSNILADTIFTFSQDSLFILRNNKNVLIGRVNKREILDESEILPLKEVIESRIKRKWNTEWETRFQKYYQENKNKYFTKDKFKFRYLLLPIDTLLVKITEKDAIIYYHKNFKKYSIPKKVKLETIFLKQSIHLDKDIRCIQSALSPPYRTSFSVLSKIYFTLDKLTKKNYNFININNIDKGIKSAVDTLKIGEINSPIHTSDGCYIIKLLAANESIIPDFQEVRDDVLNDIKHQIADSLAYKRVHAIFDSLNSISDILLQQYDSLLYQTDYIPVSKDSKQIDSIFQISKSDINLFKKAKIGSKITRVFHTENGYAILFLLDRISGEQITGYDSYALARREFSQIIKYEQSKIFTDYLLKLAKDNNDSLISVFGGLRETGEVKFSDLIDNLENSSIIVRDAFNRDRDTYSHIIRFSDDGFGFYYVVDKKVVTLQEFIPIKEQFRKEYVNNKFNEWFEDYKVEKQVRIAKKH